MRPKILGLNALTEIRLSPTSGHPVLADHLGDTLYIMVERARHAPEIRTEGVRLLSAGSVILVPYAAGGSPRAHWISPPRQDPPPLPPADRLTQTIDRLAKDGRAQAPVERPPPPPARP
ncbi:hypothetical protein Sros01_74320 [Streptomyces roseochromogenus]|nr:hypothetical protein Sros01_74320 [Streptomyces roseochromogenus]